MGIRGITYHWQACWQRVATWKVNHALSCAMISSANDFHLPEPLGTWEVKWTLVTILQLVIMWSMSNDLSNYKEERRGKKLRRQLMVVTLIIATTPRQVPSMPVAWLKLPCLEVDEVLPWSLEVLGRLADQGPHLWLH